MKEQTRDIFRQIPWRGVIAILLAGVLVSFGIVYFRQQERASHTLTFLNGNGQLLEQQEVKTGGFAVPPSIESDNDGIAFRRWSQNLYGIHDSTELYPVYQDLREEKNAFYMDAQYARLDREVEAELWLHGAVCISSIELILEYDPEVLQDFVCDVENSPFTVAAEERGKVVLRLDENQNITEAMTVAVVRFTINEKRTDIASTRIQIGMKDPLKIGNGGEVGTDCCVVHGDIYLLS